MEKELPTYILVSLEKELPTYILVSLFTLAWSHRYESRRDTSIT